MFTPPSFCVCSRHASPIVLNPGCISPPVFSPQKSSLQWNNQVYGLSLFTETHTYSEQIAKSLSASLCAYPGKCITSPSSDGLGCYIRPPFQHHDLLSRCMFVTGPTSSLCLLALLHGLASKQTLRKQLQFSFSMAFEYCL